MRFTGSIEDFYRVPEPLPHGEATRPANEVSTVLVDAPLLLVAGTADVRSCPERVRSLHARLCELGQSVELVAAWLQDRLTDDRCRP